MAEIEDLTDKELLKAYLVGEKWLNKNEQVTGTDETPSGEKYDHDLWFMGLKRIEKLEDEINKRKIWPK